MAVVRVPPASLSGFGLGETEPAHHAARREQWHMSASLVIRTETHDRRRSERGVCGNGEAVGRVHFRELVNHDHEAQQVESGPAQLLGPWDAEQPQLAHLADALPGNVASASCFAAIGATSSRANWRTISRVARCCSLK